MRLLIVSFSRSLPRINLSSISLGTESRGKQLRMKGVRNRSISSFVDRVGLSTYISNFREIAMTLCFLHVNFSRWRREDTHRDDIVLRRHQLSTSEYQQ